MARVEIHGAEFPIEKVFSNDFVFSIPLYQRPYAWTVEEVSELLDDLITALGTEDGNIKDKDPYFLGSVVLVKGHSPEAEIVDGQQRLATLTILLSVLRDSIRTSDPAFADGLTEFLYERGNPVRGTTNRYRFTPRPNDTDFFRRFVQDKGGLSKLQTLSQPLPDAQRNMREGALHLLDALRSKSVETLKRLAEYMMQRCFLVVVSTPDMDSAYRIFSVLNDRGLDLSHADILKAEVIGGVSAQLQEEYGRKWEDVETDLGRDPFQDLFSHIRMVFRKAKLRETVLKEFRQYVKPHENPRQFVDETLLPMADAYGDILGACYQSTDLAGQINEVFRWLHRIDNADWVPPAILYLMRHNDEPSDLLRFMRDLERLAAGMMISRTYVNRRIRRYGKLLSAIENDADLYDTQSPLQLTDEERVGIVQTLDGNLYEQVPVRSVLLRLDSALSAGGASYDFPVISIEHVLPQHPKPNSIWLQWFPNEESRKNTVHRLGNLVLLSRRKNSQAQNFDFERKKLEYFARKGVSPFAITTQVLSETEWTPDVVERRQAQLLAKLKEVWRL